MKIRLIFAPWEFGGEEMSRIYPLGIAYLGACLEKEGYDVKGLNFGDKKEEHLQDYLKNILPQDNPDIVGLSVLTSNRTSSFKCFEAIKRINPKITTIAGGVHATLMYKQVLENYNFIDFVVLGEGEHTMIELARAIKNKEPISKIKKIKGLAFRHNGKIIHTGCRERISDLDSLPFPKHEYFKDQISKYKIAYIMSSRGCPFNCAFCPSKPFWGRMIYQRSAENVFSEIKEIIRKFPGVNLIYFADDEFIVDNKRVINLCKKIIKAGIKIELECGGGRVTSINEELIYWMKKAGFRAISIGIESGSPAILKNMNKNQAIPQIIRAVEICRKGGIVPRPLLIVGFPGETGKTVNETIWLLKRLKLIGEAGFLFLTPGTGVYELAKKQGYISDDYWLSPKPIPFYFKENSQSKMMYWSLKIALLSSLGAKGIMGGVHFIQSKIIRKLNKDRIRAMIKRFIR